MSTYFSQCLFVGFGLVGLGLVWFCLFLRCSFICPHGFEYFPMWFNMHSNPCKNFERDYWFNIRTEYLPFCLLAFSHSICLSIDVPICSSPPLHLSSPIHLPQALANAPGRAWQNPQRAFANCAGAGWVGIDVHKGGAEWQGLKTQRRQKSWKESGDVCRNKLVFWCEHLRTSKFRSLAYYCIMF